MANKNPVNNQKAQRGKNRRAGNAPESIEARRVRLAKEYGIKPKTKELVDMLIENPGMTQTEAYRILHTKANNNTARSNVAKTLQKPSVIGYRDSAVKKAKRRIITLVDSDNESISLKASQDIIDRNEGKATIKTENTTRTIKVTTDLQGLRIGAHYMRPDQDTALIEN